MMSKLVSWVEVHAEGVSMACIPITIAVSVLGILLSSIPLLILAVITLTLGVATFLTYCRKQASVEE